jgi:hypothetical protein
MDTSVVRANADLRLLRAAVFTTACVALSAAGHILAAGATIPLWAIGTAAALVFAVAAPLAGRERTMPGIATALAVGQITLHALFASGQGAATAAGTVAGGSGERSGLRMLAGSLLCNDRLLATMTEAQARRIVTEAGLAGGTAGEHSGHAVASGGDGIAAECLQTVVRAALAMASGHMLLGHLTAALAAGWLLRRGEAALWQLVRLSAAAADELLLRALRSALRSVRALAAGLRTPDAAVRTSAADRHHRGALEPGALRHSVVRRGPPAGHSDHALTA